MRRRVNMLKVVLISIMLALFGVYMKYKVIDVYLAHGGYVDTTMTLDVKEYEKVPIHLNELAKYNIVSDREYVKVEVKGTVDKIAEFSKDDLKVEGEVSEGDKEQEVVLGVEGLNDYIVDIKPKKVKVNLEKKEGEVLEPKVFIKGKPKKDIKTVKIEEEIRGYFTKEQESTKEGLQAKVEVDAEGLKGDKVLKGSVLVENKEGKEVKGVSVEPEEVDVKMVTKKKKDNKNKKTNKKDKKKKSNKKTNKKKKTESKNKTKNKKKTNKKKNDSK